MAAGTGQGNTQLTLCTNLPLACLALETILTVVCSQSLLLTTEQKCSGLVAKFVKVVKFPMPKYKFKSCHGN